VRNWGQVHIAAKIAPPHTAQAVGTGPKMIRSPINI
jgi:hypothetical protein